MAATHVNDDILTWTTSPTRSIRKSRGCSSEERNEVYSDELNILEENCTTEQRRQQRRVAREVREEDRRRGEEM
jgi:hypothetical protein